MTSGLDRLALGLTAVASVAYVWAALAAARTPYWMDEVLAVWTARQGSVHAVWEALRHGAEFSPPLYHLLLRAILELGFDDPVMLRLPSIIAIYVVALAAFVLVRRRFALPIACLALVFCLGGPLFFYAMQARQYAGVAACFAVACTLWDGPAERPVSALRALGIGILLSVAVGMHFYAILLAAALGLMELGWMLRYRRIRWAIVLALLASAASLLLWLPIMQAASAYNHGDAAAPGYYARPTLARLSDTFTAMIGCNDVPSLATLGILLCALVTRLLAGRRAAARRDDLAIIASVTCAIPILIFAFAVFVTGTYNPRYAIVTALGFALVVAQCVAAHRRGGGLACVLIAASTAMLLSGGGASRDVGREDAIDLVAHAPAGLPIATGNGLRFFEVNEAVARKAERRLVFLTVPDLGGSPDPTNAHQVERWARIDPGLPIVSIREFLEANPELLLYVDRTSPDMVPRYLEARGYTAEQIGARTGMGLYVVRRPAGAQGDR